MDRSELSLHVQQHRRHATRNGKTEHTETGVRVLRRQIVGRHAGYRRRRLGADDAEQVSWPSAVYKEHICSTVKQEQIKNVLRFFFLLFSHPQEQRRVRVHVQRDGSGNGRDDKFRVFRPVNVRGLLQ